MSAGNIIAFGYHDQQAQRHVTLKKQFLSENEEFVECHTNENGILKKYIHLTSIFRKKSKNINTVIVMFPGHILMPIAWILTRFPRKKLIFDAFISLWDTQVNDRKKYSTVNPISWIIYLVDFFACFLADEILIDTETHKKYFVSKFKIKPKKIRVIYLETRTDLFYPKIKDVEKKDYFEVLFFGTFIPLQGIEYILDAAEILQKSNQNAH
ncbi:MAG: hypothetical protein KAS32_12235, partial [Candidatus Peribacteraceae bacterium]|nr:hypothetical protein [Candidatus Peribacteraceae bacterium]